MSFLITSTTTICYKGLKVDKIHVKYAVTENFSCPFCLVKCASYEGLRFHLTSSHDFFGYEFWVTEDYQVVIVSMRTDICSYEIIPENVDPKQEMVFYCSWWSCLYGSRFLRVLSLPSRWL